MKRWPPSPLIHFDASNYSVTIKKIWRRLLQSSQSIARDCRDRFRGKPESVKSLLTDCDDHLVPRFRQATGWNAATKPIHAPAWPGIGLAPLLVVSGACAMADQRPAAAPGNARLTVSGLLTREGAECPALKGDDGQLYTLVGDLRDLPTQGRVCVAGERLEFSTCQQGIPIRVSALTPANQCHPDRIS